MSIFAPSLGSLWKQLEGYGIDPDPVFRAEGIDPESIFDAGARVSVDKFQALDLRAQDLSGDPHFGLKSAEFARPAHLGALGFAWLASSSLRSAFARLSRYSRLIQDKLKIELEEDEEYFTVRIDARIPLQRASMREDQQLAIMTRFCRIIAGKEFAPARVCFKQDEPANTAYHYELFRCPIVFNCDSTALVMRQEDMDRRLTGSNAELATLNEHIVIKYLAHSEKQDIVNQVKAAIIDGLSNGAVTEKSVSEALFMTPRNVHRKLQREGTTFKQLLNEVRQDLAKQYLQDRSKTLTEISFLLGFSEVSSFSRAFKGWTGVPPSAARAAVD